MKKHIPLFILLFILPVLLVITVSYLKDARGPYWLGTNSDPDYVYLLNSSNMADLKKVGHIDHPGTPVQMLGAGVLRVVHLFSSTKDNLHTDVLKRPEFYLNAINGVLLALNFFMILLLGIGVYRLTGSLIQSLLLQFTPFLIESAATGCLTKVNPEPFLFLTGLLLVFFLVKWTRSDPHAFTFKEPILCGMIMGLGIATKMTFLPLAVIPFVVFPKIKAKAVYFGSSILSFVMFTLPIINMYPKFFDWIMRLMTREGRYGTGKEQFIDWDACFKNTQQLLTENRFFTFVLGLSILVLLAGILVPVLRKRFASSRYFKLIGAVILSDLLAMFMISKHTGQHYLLPVLSLSCFSLYLIHAYVHEALNHFKIKTKYLTMASILVMAGLIIWLNPYREMKQTAGAWKIVRNKSIEINDFVQQNYQDYARIYYYGSSSPAFALKFGNDLSLNYHRDVLQRLYPDVYFYDFIHKEFYGFNYNETNPIAKLQLTYRSKIVFQGPEWLEIPGLKLKPVRGGKFMERILVLDQKEFKAFNLIQEWVVQHIPKGQTLVVPKEAAIYITSLQADYNIVLLDIKRLQKPAFLNMGVFLENPYFLVPFVSFYGKSTLPPLFEERLDAMRYFIDREALLPNDEKPRFFIGRLKKSAFDFSSLKYKELAVWQPLEKNPANISPAMESLDMKGQFGSAYQSDGARNCFAVWNTAPSTDVDPAFWLLGYMANNKGLAIDLARVDRVYFVSKIYVSDNMMNKENHMFIQDFCKDWEREKVFFPAPGWYTYYMSKKIRPGSAKLLFGWRFTPRKLQDKLMVKDVKAYILFK
ncbi:MAG: hypothetical protein ACM3SY_01100 [Candidatus Omnitrophota bacterium]